LSFHPTSTASSARAPQACCILQPTMGFTEFPPSVHWSLPGFCVESLRAFTLIPLLAPGLSHSVRFESAVSNHPPKVFPPPQPYPVSSLKIEERCKQRFFEDCSWVALPRFRSVDLPGPRPLSLQELLPSSVATEVAVALGRPLSPLWCRSSFAVRCVDHELSLWVRHFDFEVVCVATRPQGLVPRRNP